MRIEDILKESETSDIFVVNSAHDWAIKNNIPVFCSNFPSVF